ncbi:hypothetical protein MKEN_01449500 [Mycena kentingensis (nom. inval.)]|nr:hypothetical protein MKEN_01449500 [Mycena kentingensis (nom. inval.)]
MSDADIVTTTCQLMAMAVAWGVYAVLFVVSVLLVVRKGVQGSTPRQVLLFSTCFMFTASTALAGVDTAIYLVQFSGGDYLPTSTKLQLACEVLFDSLFLMGDTIVIWRTWAICADRKSFIAAPLTVWFGGFACLFSLICVSIRNGVSSGWTVGVYDTDTTLHLSLATAALSAATNFFCTVFISVKAWRRRDIFRRQISRDASGPATRTHKIMSVLVESGLIYLAIWMVAMLNFYLNWNAPVLQAMLRGGIDMVMGLYPTLIIALVHIDYTVWGSVSTTSRTRTADSGSNTAVLSSMGSMLASEPDAEKRMRLGVYP